MITITYVTITYNAASVLQRTLDSVLAQDYPDRGRFGHRASSAFGTGYFLVFVKERHGVLGQGVQRAAGG